MNRPKTAFLLACLLVPATVLGGDFVHRPSLTLRRSVNTPDLLGQPGWELVTPAQADAVEAIPPEHRKALGVAPWVAEMTAAEKAAAGQAATRRRALARAIDAETRLLGLDALKVRLQAAGKNTNAVQNRIDALSAALNDAVNQLP